MKKIDITNGTYASKWGLTDFYDYSIKILKEALNSNEDFETEWFGCDKEPNYAMIKRENGIVTVYVEAYMDDLYNDGNELIYDALDEACGIEELLPDDVIEQILVEASENNIQDMSKAEYMIDELNKDEEIIDVIINTIDQLEEQCEKNNDAMYKKLCNIVERIVWGE